MVHSFDDRFKGFAQEYKATSNDKDQIAIFNVPIDLQSGLLVFSITFKRFVYYGTLQKRATSS